MAETIYTTIDLPNGEKVFLHFGAWASKMMAKKYGLAGVNEFIQFIGEHSNNPDILIDYYLMAAKSYCIQKGIDCKYTDEDASLWVDLMNTQAIEPVKESIIDESMAGENLREVDSADNKSANVG